MKKCKTLGKRDGKEVFEHIVTVCPKRFINDE
jgi:hypothetical protein